MGQETQLLKQIILTLVNGDENCLLDIQGAHLVPTAAPEWLHYLIEWSGIYGSYDGCDSTENHHQWTEVPKLEELGTNNRYGFQEASMFT
ncbi:hypothetical protein AVEN_157160-1 [Araneus ventricosus]|uniref:Uncharacterized protein n=1 Tax=Araneus ventricosus TaxID=182803 RepID=A0A4Y2KPU7_ARAVE|nr:hypothetical protein AVEN_157160-1 [Araneus ventricosus]